MRFCLLVLVFLCFSLPLLSQEEGERPVPARLLQGDALSLPVGLIKPLYPGGIWQTADGLFFVDGDPKEALLSCLYQPLSEPLSIEEVESIIRSTMTGEAEDSSMVKIAVRPSKRPLFGTSYDYEYASSDGPVAGCIASAAGHHLHLMVSGSLQAAELRDRVAASFQPSDSASKAPKLSSRSARDTLTPVNSYLLEGSRLRLPGGSAEAPPGWTWRYSDKNGRRTYLCDDGQLGRVIVKDVLCVEDPRQLISRLIDQDLPNGEGDTSLKFSPPNPPSKARKISSGPTTCRACRSSLWRATSSSANGKP